MTPADGGLLRRRAHFRRIDDHADRRRGYAGGDPEAPVGVDHDGEGGAVFLGVPVHLLRDAEFVTPLRRERETDEATPVHRHEVDQFRRDQFRRADQVPFVLAVLVVSHDDQTTIAEVLDRLFHRAECHVPPLSE